MREYCCTDVYIHVFLCIVAHMFVFECVYMRFMCLYGSIYVYVYGYGYIYVRVCVCVCDVCLFDLDPLFRRPHAAYHADIRDREPIIV